MIAERPTISWLCEYAVEIRFQTGFSPELTSLLIRAKEWILKNPPVGLEEVVITYQCITVFYNPLLVSNKLGKLETSPYQYVSTYLKDIPFASFQGEAAVTPKEHVVAVKYGSEDLEVLSLQLRLPVQSIIDIHQSVTYSVYMVGFLPGFPYLGSLPEELQVPRKDKPTLRVKAGSVAIAGKQTGIYSQDSPGGWHVLGKTDIKLFDVHRKYKSLFQAGDLVRFKAI